MSADTTMAILKTRKLFEPGKYEFRVRMVQAAENAYPDEEGFEPDARAFYRQWYLQYAFGGCTVYNNARSARNAARRKVSRLRRQGRIIEYGVRTIDLSGEHFPLLSLQQLEDLLRTHKIFPFHNERPRPLTKR